MDTRISAASAAGEERLVYSVAEAGALLGISRAFAYELVARGELPVIRLGRRRLVPKAALNAACGRRADCPARRRDDNRRSLTSTRVSTQMSTPQVRTLPGTIAMVQALRNPEQSRSAKPRRSTCRAPDLDGSELCQWTQWIWPAPGPARKRCCLHWAV